MKLRLGVIFGGRSGEHEISIRSAKTVIEQADSAKYDIVPLAITNDGRWLSPAESLALFPGTTQGVFRDGFPEPSAQNIAMTGDTAVGGLAVIGDQKKMVPLDVVFPLLHGTYGEDGKIQ